MYGQFVLGPPGSGKSTYCYAMEQFFASVHRPISIINLDPANTSYKYHPIADIKQLIQLEEVCELTSLGPNGAFIYCMQFLLTNISWLLNIIEKHKPQYIVFDTPGQVELYAIDGLVRDLLNKLSASNINLCCVHLIDCQYCTDINKYISATFLTLSAMIQIEKPFVNV